MLNSYDDVFDYYKNKTVWFSNLIGGKILKTDCFNEANGRPVATKDMTIIEYDQEMIDKAKKADPELNIIRGDIRSLPFDNESFDGILDLSTLDHIDNPDLAIEEYYRVLKPEGYLLLITWVGPKQEDTDEWKSTNQYFFNRDELKNILDEKFEYGFSQDLFTESEPNYHHGTLIEFICQK